MKEDRKNAIKIVTILKAAFPTFLKENDKAMLNMTVQTWHKYTKDLNFDLVQMAIDKYIATSNKPFAPSISEIRTIVNELENGQHKTDAEAWDVVMTQIRRCGIYEEKSALESLDEVTRKAVRAIGYREMCLSENKEIIRAQFNKYYNSLSTRQKEKEISPLYLQKLQEIANKKRIPQIPQIVQNKQIEQIEPKEKKEDNISTIKDILKNLKGVEK
jgi:macrodomain Ter protein organizer (MatP/YcbG family)